MTVPGQGQAPNPDAGQTPPGDTTATTDATTTTTTDSGDGQAPAAGQESFGADYVKKLRQEAAANRKRADDLEAKVRKDEEAKLSETERLKKAADDANKRADEALEKARQALVRSALMVELGKQGAKNPALAYRLIDQADVDLAEDGTTVTGAAEAVKALLTAEPYLKGTATTADGGPPTTPKSDGAPSKEELVKAHSERLQGTGLFQPL